MFKKRGQGLSITVIVAAVIGLIVLVVIVAVLTGRLGGFSKGVDAASRRYNQKLCGYWNGIYFERLYNCLYISYISNTSRCWGQCSNLKRCYSKW